MNVYLDNAATTPMLPEVVEAMLPYMRDHFGNPSSTHQFGRRTKTAIEQSRRQIAGQLGVEPRTVCFTSGGTEADNMALHAGVDQLGCQRILTCATEHSAVLKTAEHLGQREGVTCGMLQLDSDGKGRPASTRDTLSDGVPTLVSVMHGNNEVGILQDIRAIGQCCWDHNALFHSDTVQTMGHYPMDLGNMPIDFAACSAHKLHGPKGAGFLYVKDGHRIGAHIMGGSQERAMRGGTENLIGIIGLAKAIELSMTNMESHAAHIQGLKAALGGRFEGAVPGIQVQCEFGSRVTVCTPCSMRISPPTRKNGMMLFLLDLEGVACSGGVLAPAGAPSLLMCCPPWGLHEEGRTSIRFSFSRMTTAAASSMPSKRSSRFEQQPFWSDLRTSPKEGAETLQDNLPQTSAPSGWVKAAITRPLECPFRWESPWSWPWPRSPLGYRRCWASRIECAR